MQNFDLTVLFFADLPKWERELFEVLVDALGRTHKVRKIEVREAEKYWRERDRSKAYWLLSSHWRDVLSRVRLTGGGPIFVSALGWKDKTGSLFTLLWKRAKPGYFSRLKILAHSPISQRYLSEIEGVPAKKISYLALPAVSWGFIKEKNTVGETRPFAIGTFAPFSPESNLNSLLPVAHYLSQRTDDFVFRILGKGKLYRHLHQSIREMGLQNRVEVAELTTFEELSSLDMFLFVPLRNDHFIPLLAAGSLAMPVVATEMPAVNDYIQDGKTGFIVPTHDTKPLGELILRVKQSPELGRGLGKELQSFLSERYSVSRLLSHYETIFFGSQPSMQLGERQAA